jgi:succinate dehydrogenase/fumarate reductase-like Fe-S protein
MLELEKIRMLFTKKERKVIKHLASKPKAMKKFYSMWKCIKCEKEFYYQPLRCPICAGELKAVRKYSTYFEYPVTRYAREEEL